MNSETVVFLATFGAVALPIFCAIVIGLERWDEHKQKRAEAQAKVQQQANTFFAGVEQQKSAMARLRGYEKEREHGLACGLRITGDYDELD